MITNFYLDQINPLQNLDLPTVINLIQLGQRGYYARLQWLYRAIEKHDPVVRAVKRRLLASLSGLDWNIKVEDVGDDPAKKALADKQAADLRAAYDAIANLRSALTFLALADLRGFSHVEKIYAGEGADDPWLVTELRIVEQWFWVRNGYYGDWAYNADAREINFGVPIDPDQFVIHTVDDPSDEIFTRLAVKREVNDADWDGFLGDYGVPPMFIIGPPNVPIDKEAGYQTTAENAVSRRRGYLPNGATLETPSATGSGGADVFSARLHYIDEQIVIGGTAGKLTVLSEAGSGTLAGTAQKEAFDEIAQAIANQVATRLHEQFDKPLLARLHPDEPVLVYFEFAQINVKDTSSVLTDAATAATAGFKIDPEELSEKSGYKLEYVGLAGAPPATGQPGLPKPGGPPPSPNPAAVPPNDPTTGKPATAAPAAPAPVSAAPAAPNDPIATVADELHVTPEFVAPAKSVIDDLIAKAQSGDISKKDLLAAATEALKRMPELALQTDVSGVADALQSALEQSAAAALA
jgi:hypothetical protein